MVQKESVREKEAEPRVSYYENSIKYYEDKREQSLKGARLLKGKDIAWQTEKQGVLRFYHTETHTGHALDTMNVFVHEIRTHSGRHVHQGGFHLFVIRGKGYSVVDGKRFDWAEGDLILLPFKKGGVEHQHFNLGDSPSRWLALWSIAMGGMVGMWIKQKELYEGYKK